MIAIIFKHKSIFSGTITNYHYQTDIADEGWHFVTLHLDSGEEKKARLQSNSYKPFEVGQRISGQTISDFDLGGNADLSLINIEEIKKNDNPYITQIFMRPLRGMFEELAMCEKWGIRQDEAMGKKPSKPSFARIAHKLGSQEYDQNGNALEIEDYKIIKEKYAETWQP